MRGCPPTLESGGTDIAEELAAGNLHGEVCEGGESGEASRLSSTRTRKAVREKFSIRKYHWATEKNSD